MGAWAGYLGLGNERRLKILLGDEAQIHTGSDFGLGVRNTYGDPVRLTTAAEGRVTATVGLDDEAYASASVDPSGPTLTLARDPFGFYGMYTTQVGEVLWCASDPRVLQRLAHVSERLDPVALHGYLCFSYVPTPLTLTPGVSALLAGDRVVVMGARDDTLTAFAEAILDRVRNRHTGE